MSRSHEARLDLARRMAETSDAKQRHGAVVVKGGRVLALGVNKFRNDPAVVPSDNPEGRSTVHGVHAEVDALRRCGDTVGATIYVARVNRRGEDRLSRPCNNCSDALIKAGISQVIYTTS